MIDGPRIAPGGRAQVGLVNHLLVRALGAAARSGPLNVFTTLARHRGLFRRWLLFAGGLMPGGLLRRADSELVILRVAHNCGSEYEWRHHQRLGELAGLTREQIERVRQGSAAAGWTVRQALLLRAADELHGPERTVSGGLWGALAAEFEERELIELCMLVGHYEMLAMTLNALHVEPDRTALNPPGRAARGLEALMRRRSRRPPADRS